jgi:hypothetical protein
MEDVDMSYGYLVHLKVYCYILWTFGIVRGNLVYFPRFGILYQEKSGNPATKRTKWQHFYQLYKHSCVVSFFTQCSVLMK